MKPRLLLCMFLSAAALLATSAKSDEPSEGILLSVRLTKTNSNEKTMVLANPSVVTPIGKPFSLISGGVLKGSLGDDDLDYGVQLDGKIQQLQDGRLHVVIKLCVSSAVTRDNDRQTHMVRGETWDVCCDLQAGKVKRVHFGGSEFCEIRVEPTELLKLN